MLSQKEVLEQLTPNQKAELILDPDLEDEAIREVLTNLTESRDDELLNQFFQAIANISKQVTA